MEFKVGDKVKFHGIEGIVFKEDYKEDLDLYPIIVKFEDMILGSAYKSFTREGKSFIGDISRLTLIECGEENHEFHPVSCASHDGKCERCGILWSTLVKSKDCKLMEIKKQKSSITDIISDFAAKLKENNIQLKGIELDKRGTKVLENECFPRVRFMNPDTGSSITTLHLLSGLIKITESLEKELSNSMTPCMDCLHKDKNMADYPCNECKKVVK
jgi:hypothetical protein